MTLCLNVVDSQDGDQLQDRGDEQTADTVLGHLENTLRQVGEAGIKYASVECGGKYAVWLKRERLRPNLSLTQYVTRGWVFWKLVTFWQRF